MLPIYTLKLWESRGSLIFRPRYAAVYAAGEGERALKLSAERK